MNYKGLISSIAGIVLIAFSLMNGSGCANIIPPMGGPRDSLPPQLLKATPGDSTRNFTGNKITFTFDEFVDVQNVQENLSVSPLPKMNPSVEFKLNTITLKLKDTLEPNTTYFLNFGDAIKDNNEGNVLKKFTYTFSTGRYLDSLTFNGKVILAETGKVDSTLIVMLHTSPDDSSVVKEKPRYITKLNATGTFVFKNLPPKTFYIYVLKDEGGTLRYFNDKQLFAFSDKPVVLPGNTEPVILYAYATKPSLPITGIPAINPGNRNNKTGGTIEKRLKYQTNLINNQQDLLGDFTMTFELPLRSFDSSKILLYTDSTYLPVTGYSFQKDSSHKKLHGVFTQSTGQSGWKENTAYHIILDKEFAEDSSGKKLLKKDTIHFKTKKLADYGALKIKFRNLDITKNPVLLFVSGEAIFKSFPLSSADFTRDLFFPGEYELRILNDDNKNGSWDPGQFFGKHKQPEIVKPVERKVTVKPAWKNEFEIAL